MGLESRCQHAPVRKHLPSLDRATGPGVRCVATALSTPLTLCAALCIRAAYTRHVSSITYHPILDLFAVTEGDEVMLRTPSSCTIGQIEAGFRWPHDAVVLPLDIANGRENMCTPPLQMRIPPTDTRLAHMCPAPQGVHQLLAAASWQVPNRSVVTMGGAAYTVFVAELDGKKLKRYDTVGGLAMRNRNGGAPSLYG